MYTSYSPRDRLGFWIAFVMVAMFMRSAVGEEPFKPQRAALDYVIVVTGDELLAGAYADAHTPFIARTLGRLGLRCVGSMIVGDERPAIKEALRFATGKARLVIVTGGLGPTDNDVTREALAEFTGIAMAEQPDVLAEMERRFKVPREELRPGLRRQTRVPTFRHVSEERRRHGRGAGLRVGRAGDRGPARSAARVAAHGPRGASCRILPGGSARDAPGAP